MKQLVKSLLKNARPTTSIYNKLTLIQGGQTDNTKVTHQIIFRLVFTSGGQDGSLSERQHLKKLMKNVSDSVYQYIFICMAPPKNKATKVLGYTFFKSKR